MCAPSHADAGLPNTDATDQPRNTAVMAAARRSGAITKPSVAAACGVNTAAPIMVALRTMISVVRFGASAHSACPTAYNASEPASKVRRSMREVNVASTGEPMHMPMAAMVISSAVCGTVAERSVDSTTSSPGTNITPVPITKLPNRNARTKARSWCRKPGVLFKPLRYVAAINRATHTQANQHGNHHGQRRADENAARQLMIH